MPGEIMVGEFVSCFTDAEREIERERDAAWKSRRAGTRRIDGETRSVTQNDPRGPEETVQKLECVSAIAAEAGPDGERSANWPRTHESRE